ncbi:Alpha/Beta hydrolase protein [Tricharina praecox]|uniref:Alpha/Beta hydrolase protein n=1 Tax=Tricharina praecox TaxID=43433 RepID=UPI0022200A59|nr:Alpha/Beta hydrolase protein [Tricharina praecox]KAI5856051.1 Alpha/Beta hydrolase protein [Tricharina praecox]
MIDHVLGRPSLQFRKYQVLAVLLFWSLYLLRGNPHGPPILLLRHLSKIMSKRLTPFQTVTLTLLYLYVTRNFAKLLNLESPEPLANLYTRSYFRATWVMTALDAGFWTAMRIRRKWLRDACSMVFSVYYLFAAERADEKVRRVRATITVDHLRVSWEKPMTPYLRFLSNLLHPPHNKFAPRPLRIPRPKESVYSVPVDAWLYYEGTREQLRSCKKVILDFPGGGFVAMSPRHHDDKLLTWARLCPGVPVISIDYKKAPEYPYPYALNECYDAYHSIITTRGRCVGLSGDVIPKIALTGDSAGGNFTAATVLMILNAASTSSTGYLMEAGWKGLPLPEGVILIYPSLDLNMSSWMSDEQLKLIRQRSTMDTNRNVVRKKSEYYEKASGTSRHPSPHPSPPSLQTAAAATAAEYSTRLAMTSRLSYFNDRILTPEMMRAMVILYIGPHRPDFQTDFFLSPIVAPESLLARFPPVYFLTGERDPLVDDTLIFAGRIRAAKQAARQHRRNLGLKPTAQTERGDAVEVSLIQGISHGFLQMAALFPQARRELRKCAVWLNRILEDVPGEEAKLDVESDEEHPGLAGYITTYTSDEDRPLEIGGGLGGVKVEGKGRGRNRNKRLPRGRGKRRGSVVSLGSEDDLMGRRMQGLTNGLAGEPAVDGDL